MKNINYTIAITNEELEQIIQLQRKNLVLSVSTEEKKKEGFVTVQHDFDVLKKMNDHQPHIIAKDDATVVGYTLCMTKYFATHIPILAPMFTKIDTLLNPASNYIVMGQVCIAKMYRKQGVFRGLYQKMKIELQDQYELLITEVAADNIRSLQAHYAIGFKELTVYQSDAVAWHLIYWDWR